jgi:UDP-3-O-[3-hydroxymyristoyl] glucosamine N-acyltransferase
VIYSGRVRLRELAERLHCHLEGDGDIEIHGIAGLDHAGPGEVSFLSNPRYTRALGETRASAVILGQDAPAAPCAVLRSADPYLAFANAAIVFARPVNPPLGIDPRAAVAANVELGIDVSIGAFVSIAEGTRIGARTVIYPHATVGREVIIGNECIIHSQVSVRERTVIGHRVVIQNGAVLGSDGFGFARRPDGTYQKIPQRGVVIIEDDAEVGANTTIDRPVMGETRISAGAKLDNLVQIGHSVTVGRNTLLAAQVGVAGSSKIGDDVILAGQVGVAGHLELGKGVRATAQTGIPNSVEPGTLISGYPAIPNRDWLKASAIFRKLPELKKLVANLERRLTTLETRLTEQVAKADDGQRQGR